MSGADFQIDTERGGAAVLRLSGDWTTTGLGRIPARLTRELDGRAVKSVELSEMGRFDTAGALA
ncbi:MAG: ABC transporter permease, partial [Brevundimonas sp.]